MSDLVENKIGCKARELKNNWKTLMDPDAVKISGHIKKVTEVHDNVIVFVETCECCGEVSLTWAKPGPLAENLKRLSGFPYDKGLTEIFDSMRAGK